MDKLQLLLIEDDEDERRAIVNAVARRKDFTLIGATGDSDEALKLCSATPPDAVILDLELHYGGGDGLSFLDGVKKLRLPYKPYVLVTTNNISTLTHSAVRILGADYILTKNQRGYCADYVLDFILNAKPAFAALRQEHNLNGKTEIDPDICANQMQKVILAELNQLGFKPGNIGYTHLRDAILAAMEDPAASAINTVAQNNKKSRDSVSRAIQNEINRVWTHSDKEFLYERYTAQINKDRGAPTSKEFIHYYAVKLKCEIL